MPTAASAPDQSHRGIRASADGSRSSSQRAQPTSIPSRPRGAWVTSVRNSSLRPRLACECVRRRPPPTAQRSGKTSAARRELTRPARTIHSKAANTMTSRTNTRCWNTAGYAQLSQNPRGPRGQAPGSSRIMRKTASPRKISGQWRAQRARQRGQRRRDEEGREAEAKLDRDEPPEPRGADIARGREPAHREEVHRAQGEEGGEDRHLGEHHDAVRRAEERAEPADEGEREREPRGDEGRDGRERERREALEQQRRPRALAPPEPRHDEMREAADPRRRPDLVETIERQQKTARPEPRRRVTRPRRARGERQRHPEQCEPATPGARR